MRRVSTHVLTVVALMLVVSVAGQAQQTLMTRHTRDEVINRVAPLIGHLSASQSLRIVLVLPHRNQAELDQFLNDVYDRSNPAYRHFLTVDQFTEKFGPSREDYDSVKSWAIQNGLHIESTARNRVILPVSGSVQDIEKALHVTLGVYQHPTENRTFFAPDREPTPDTPVRLWSIGGLDNFSRPTPMFTRRDANAAQPDGVIDNATTGSCPSKSFCGSDMRAAYYGGTALTGAGQSLGLFEFVGTDLADLTTYYKNAGQTNNVPITLLSVDGQKTSCTIATGCDDTEQTLDMTQALGMAPGMSSLVMYIGKGGLSGQTLDDAGILNAMATASPLNAQLSCSWAWRPPDPSTDEPYFKEFAAQGQNFFTASGDSGKWKSTLFVWPADDAYITSVGGTDLTTTSAGGPWSSETAWIDSGGGTTPDGFAIPSWQVAAAAGCAACSQTLRNGPDVSANANFTFYVCADQTACTANNYGGTSFATPMWAGFLALVNQQAVANGSSVLGFVNPALYAIYGGSSYTTDFHDITTGSQTGGTNTATVGYDVVTGIGSPNGQPLIDALAGTSGGFSLSASPSTVSVAQGGSGTSTITSTTTGGFNSAVTLSASGQPTGVTVGFNPNSITGNGNSTMTMTVGSSTVAGTYPITVTGTSGSTTETTTVTLTVTGKTGSFVMTASPKTLTIARGASGQSKITTMVGGGFDSAITLTASGQGTGVKVLFNPSTIPAPGSGHATMGIQVASTATTGSRAITVTAKGGGVTRKVTVTLTIQ